MKMVFEINFLFQNQKIILSYDLGGELEYSGALFDRLVFPLFGFLAAELKGLRKDR